MEKYYVLGSMHTDAPFVLTLEPKSLKDAHATFEWMNVPSGVEQNEFDIAILEDGFFVSLNGNDKLEIPLLRYPYTRKAYSSFLSSVGIDPANMEE